MLIKTHSSISAEWHHTARLPINEELEALRFKRIDELLSMYGKESESNEQTVKRVHLRVDRLETQIKTVKSFGTGIATLLGGIGAWMGLNNK